MQKASVNTGGAQEAKSEGPLRGAENSRGDLRSAVFAELKTLPS